MSYFICLAFDINLIPPAARTVYFTRLYDAFDSGTLWWKGLAVGCRPRALLLEAEPGPQLRLRH